MTRRSPAISDRLAELERRVGELERELTHLRDHEPDTSVEDWIEGVDRRAFAQLLTHLEFILPDFSARRLRETVELLEGLHKEPDPTADLANRTFNDWFKMRIGLSIKELFPESIYEGEAPLEPSPSDPRDVLRRRISGLRRTPPVRPD